MLKNENLDDEYEIKPYETMRLVLMDMSVKMESSSNFVFINLIDTFLKLGEDTVKLIQQFYCADETDIKKKCIEILQFQKNILDKRLKHIVSLPDANITWYAQEVLTNGKDKLDKDIEFVNNQNIIEELNTKRFMEEIDFKLRNL